MSLNTKKLFFVLPILVLFLSADLFAGTFQGGGGGRTNSSIRMYLDTRIYGLYGAERSVVPNIMLTNACLDGNTVHTIEPVWQCKEVEMASEPIDGDDFGRMKPVRRCKKKVRDHLQRSFKPVQKVCEKNETRIVAGVKKKVCIAFSKNKLKKFKTKYKLDVYRLNIGEGGTGLKPNLDHDYYMKTINYSIPTCNELNID